MSNIDPTGDAATAALRRSALTRPPPRVGCSRKRPTTTTTPTTSATRRLDRSSRGYGVAAQGLAALRLTHR
jgi:hypothetical protein